MKDFDKWNEIKKVINGKSVTEIYFFECEIWWCHIGANVGSEQGGIGNKFLRPVLILKKLNRQLCWVIPLSQKVLKGSFFFPLLSESSKIRTALLSQLKLIDSRRLVEQIDRISELELSFIKKEIIALIR
jgi:mRNA interferase MazF